MNGSLGLGIELTLRDNASGGLVMFGRNMGMAHEKAKSAADGIAASLGRVVSAAAVIAGTAMLVHASTEEASQFGKEIAKVATEVDKAKFSQEEMRKVTRQLAGDFGRLPTDEAKALYDAVGLGADTASKSLTVMTAANRLAVAGDADLKTSLDALQAALKANGKDWSAANDYADTMFTAMRSGKLNVQELAGSLGRITSMSANLGLTFEETTAAIAAMTSTGISANEAVSGLHEAFANILHPEKKAAAEISRLGISFDSATLKSKGLYGLLQDITGAKGFGGVETMKKLFPSVEGFNAIMQITAGNMRGFTDALDAMKDKAGAAERGFKIMTETADFQEKRYEALKHVALGYIGEALEPMKVGMVKFANSALESFNQLDPATQGLIVKGTLLAITLGLIAGGAVSLIGAAFVPLAAAIGLVGLALAGLKEAYDKDLGGFKQFVDQTVGQVKLAWDGLGQVFSQGGFSGAVMDELNKAENQGVKEFVIGVYVWAGRIKNFFSGLADGFSAFIDSAKPVIGDFVAAIEEAGAAIFGTMEGIDPSKNYSKWERFGEIGRSVGETLGRIATAALKVVTALIRIGVAVGPGIEKMGEDVLGVVGDFGSLLSEVRDVGVELGLLDASADRSGSMLAQVFGLMVEGLHAFMSPVRAFFGAFGNVLRGALSIVGGIVEAMTGNVTQGVTRILYGMATLVVQAVLGVVRMAAGLVDMVMSPVLGYRLSDKVADWSKSADDTLRSGFSLETADQKKQHAIREAQDLYAADSVPTPEPGPMASIAQAEAQGGSAADFTSAASALMSVADRPIQVQSTVYGTVDGEVLMTIIEQHQVTQAVRSGVPVASQ